MNDAEIASFVDALLRQEVIPTLDLPAEDLHRFADAVLGRFRNPFIRHQLSAIALNSMTKFRTRLLPQLLAGHQQTGQWPTRITFALAALLAYYRGERDGEARALQDDAQWLDRFATLWPQQAQGAISLRQLVAAVLSDAQHWQQDLSQLPDWLTPLPHTCKPSPLRECGRLYQNEEQRLCNRQLKSRRATTSPSRSAIWMRAAY